MKIGGFGDSGEGRGKHRRFPLIRRCAAPSPRGSRVRNPLLRERVAEGRVRGVGSTGVSPSSAAARHLLPGAAIFGAALIFNVLDARGGALITGAVRSELVLCAGRFLLA